MTAKAIPPLLILAVVAFYLQVAGFGFVNWDDDLFVYKEPFLQQGLTFQSWRWAWSLPERAFFTPLSRLSYLLDVTLFGMNPGAMHLVNLLFHAFNVALLYSLLRRLTLHTGASLLAAVVFAVHPQHVEAVAWISERKEVMSFFFGMLAIYGYVVAVEKNSRPALLASVGCYLLSLLVKPLWVTLPLLLLLLDHWPLKRPMGVMEKWPYWLLSALFSGLTLITFVAQENITSLQEVTFDQRLSNLVVAYGLYVTKAVVPVGLAPLYPHPGDELAVTTVWLAAAGLLVISGFVWQQLARRPALAVGWLWFLGTLFPVSGLINGGQVVAMADRWSYLPHVGLLIAVIWGLTPALSLPRSAKTGLVGGVVVLFGWLSWQQTTYWKDSETLWLATLRVVPPAHAELAHFLLGLHYQEVGRLPEAVAQLTASYRIQPADPFLVAALATLHDRLGQSQRADELRVQLLHLPATVPDVLLSTGLNLFKRGLHQEARFFFTKTLTSQGRAGEWARDEARFFLGLGYWLAGRGAEAAPHWQIYFQGDPGRCDAVRRLLQMEEFQGLGEGLAEVNHLCSKSKTLGE